MSAKLKRELECVISADLDAAISCTQLRGRTLSAPALLGLVHLSLKTFPAHEFTAEVVYVDGLPKVVVHLASHWMED